MNKSTPQNQHVPSRKKSRVLNIRLLMGTLIALGILAPALYCWNYYQTNRSAHSYLDRADQLESKGQFRAAADYLNRFLQLYPNDGDVRLRLAKDFNQSAKDFQSKRRAIELYYQALGLLAAEKVPETRVRLAELLLETNQFTPAQTEAKQIIERSNELLSKNEEDSQGKYLRAQGKRLLSLALYRQHQSGATINLKGDESSPGKVIEEALELNTGDQELSLILAHIYREAPQLLSEEEQSLAKAERERRANQVMDAMIEAQEKDSAARLARYIYRNRYQLPGAADDLEAAGKSDPDNLNVLLARAADEQAKAIQTYREKGRIDDARPHFNKAGDFYIAAIKVAPTDDRAYVSLGEVYYAQGQVDKAVSICKQGLEKVEGSIRLNLLLARMLLEQGNINEVARMDKDGHDGPLDMLDRLADRLTTAANAGSEAARREKTSLNRSIALLRAEWLIKQRQHLQSLPLLKQVVAGENVSSEENIDVFRAWMLLGECYAALNQWDQASAAFDKASTLNSQSLQAHKAAAEAWTNLGRLDLAIRHCDQALAIDKNDVESKLLLAMARFQIESQKPKNERNWSGFEKAMSMAQESLVDSSPQVAMRLKLLNMSYILIRGEEQGDPKTANQTAVEKLHEAEASNPASSSQMAELIFAYERLGSSADVDRLLKEYEKTADQPATNWLIRARLAGMRKDYKQARQVLQTGISKVKPEEKKMLQKELIQLFLFEGRFDDAKQELQQMIKDHEAESGEPFEPAVLALISQLVEHALEKPDFEEAKLWENELQKIEGADGSLWRYCKARRLLTEVSGVNDPKLAEAEKLQAEILTLRPAWSTAHILNAMILQRRGKLEQAAEAYQAAIKLGEHRLAVFESLVALLYKLERFAEAEKYLAQLQDQVPASSVLTSLELADASRHGKWTQAIEIARQGVTSRPTDPMAYIWLGRMLLADNNTAEAEVALRNAVQHAPADPSAYYALLNFYVQTKQKDKALETITQITYNKQIPLAARNLLLAQGYDLLQDQEKAKASYNEMAKSAEDTAAAQTNLANQLLKHDPEAAEKALRRALQLDPRYSPARRLLARLLVDRGGEKEWQEAISLMDGLSVDDRNEPLNQSLRAAIFAQRGGRDNLEKAQQIAEKLVSDSKGTEARDLLLLATIYEAEGKLPEARERLLELVTRPTVPSAYLVNYIDMLLRHDLSGEVEPWLKKLETAAPETMDAMALRSRWLRSQGRSKEIEPLVENLAEKLLQRIPKNPQDETDLCMRVGNIYTAVKMHSAAERWYRRAKEKAPEKYEPLAMSLALQGKIADAIRLCLTAAERDPSPHTVQTLVLLLGSSKPTNEDFELAEPLLVKAKDTYGKNPDILNAIANVRILQQRLKEAADLYREVLQLRPRDVTVMNNLATVLAEQPSGSQEGMHYVEQAMALAGPQPGLLDTKGMILVFGGKAEEAVPLLEMATAAPNADPRYYFHLAVAYLRTGDLEKARNSLKRAYDGDLTSQILTPGDKKLLAELEQSLKQT